MSARECRIGVVSDTHGLLRPEVLEKLQGVDHILHAGDVGDAAILEALRAIAPTTAIRGNIDTRGPCSHLPATETVEIAGCLFYMLHDRHARDLNPEAAGIAAVISGHSHQPVISWERGVLFFNPGSAGPRRFSLPVTVGEIRIAGRKLEPAILPLIP
jgi:hypothetical protein